MEEMEVVGENFKENPVELLLFVEVYSAPPPPVVEDFLR